MPGATAFSRRMQPPPTSAQRSEPEYIPRPLPALPSPADTSSSQTHLGARGQGSPGMHSSEAILPNTQQGREVGVDLDGAELSSPNTAFVTLKLHPASFFLRTLIAPW